MSDDDEYEILATCIYWDLDDFPIPYDLNSNILYHNMESALKVMGYPGGSKVWFYHGNPTLPDNFIAEFSYSGFFSFILEDSGDIYERSRRMVRDALLWTVEIRVCDNPEPRNLVFVSDKFSSPETDELLSFLKALKPTNFKTLLALSEEPKSDEAMIIPTVSIDCLLRGVFIDLDLCHHCGYKVHFAKQLGQK